MIKIYRSKCLTKNPDIPTWKLHGATSRTVFAWIPLYKWTTLSPISWSQRDIELEWYMQPVACILFYCVGKCEWEIHLRREAIPCMVRKGLPPSFSAVQGASPRKNWKIDTTHAILWYQDWKNLVYLEL